MEHEKNKRAREYDDVEAEIWFSFENNNKKSKKRDVCGISFTKDKKEVGVFDFPWLKDGVISKSEDYLKDFEDNFLSPLQNQDNTFFKVSYGIDFFEEYHGLSSMTHIPEAKLMEDVWLPFEINGLEDLDCIWSSLLNK
uniref:Uncharacterized protein LOC101501938 n=1 Tax=Cicer arietinum TaxID=3827 RepID=A0A1S2XAM0_CICAR|nr:uncharacterized protein LOC101501938 [Cicer arietinum]XP_004486384.1 uncharacterized protein LOC101501938 [Cicer arietinum]XP_027191612.1 uncharacterized protein LOC101501938 [Cicer arietinum]